MNQEEIDEYLNKPTFTRCESFDEALRVAQERESGNCQAILIYHAEKGGEYLLFEGVGLLELKEVIQALTACELEELERIHAALEVLKKQGRVVALPDGALKLTDG